ncbi:MAG: efflux RND transporter periplasmic adaptor subunit, partial [Gammaproteobacteria bacterium]|nr:efflux RND transporter periplasmic adaptor subunit [Gammaproteobacteria bacterium]
MRWIVMTFGILLTAGALFVVSMSPVETASDPRLDEVSRGDLVIRSVYDGRLESRNVVTVMSKFQGLATIVELVAEGNNVLQGDALVRFDSAELEREMFKLEKEYALADSDLESLVNAKHPLAIWEIEGKRSELEDTLRIEQQYLRDSLELAKDNLVSVQEIEQQKMKVERLRAEYETASMRLQLTNDYLHPAERERAETKRHSAEQALKLARSQLRNTTIRAPSAGVVVYKPLHIGGEYRTVRVGDGIYANQPFMVIPDMADLVAESMVPESELSRVATGSAVVVNVPAYPDVTLSGRVQSVSSIAQSLPGRPAWQKFFRVLIGLADGDPRIRPGMSV